MLLNTKVKSVKKAASGATLLWTNSGDFYFDPQVVTFATGYTRLFVEFGDSWSGDINVIAELPFTEQSFVLAADVEATQVAGGSNTNYRSINYVRDGAISFGANVNYYEERGSVQNYSNKPLRIWGIKEEG